VQELKSKLIDSGYRYLLFDNIESLNNGIEIFHYTVHPIMENRIIEPGAILISSNDGEEILKEFLIGKAKLYLLTGAQLYVHTDGTIYEHDFFKPFKI